MEIVRNAFGPVAEMAATAILATYLTGVLVAFCVILMDIWAPLVRDMMIMYGSTTFDESVRFDATVLLVSFK